MKVLRFDGTFELAFLRNNEAVRSARSRGIEGVDVINAVSKEIYATASVDDVLVRKSDGTIDVIRAIGTFKDELKAK